MSAIDCTKLQPGFGAHEVRVYHFGADELRADEVSKVWLRLDGAGVSAYCSLSAEHARQIAAGLVNAASAIEAQTTARGC